MEQSTFSLVKIKQFLKKHTHTHDIFIKNGIEKGRMRAYNMHIIEVFYMRNAKKRFSFVSNVALVVMLVLVVISVATNLFISTNQTLRDIGYPGTFRALFDYSLYADGHPARFAGQILSNLVAYVYMFAALLLFVLSLALVKHDKGAKAKCAFIALLVLVPATLGLTGGMINFFGEGYRTLMELGGPNAAGLIGLTLATFALDFAYLFFAALSLFYGLRIAVKVNKGELVEEPEEQCCCGGHQETPEEKAAREEKEAADRVALLDDIRKIVREELNRLDRVVIAKEAPVVYARPKQEPAPAPAPAPKPAPAPVEEEEDDEKRKSAQRIPFAQKMVKAEKDLQDKYNELKNEILAYGAKSRVSISGDTFRLHRKAYVKITLVGKTLKVYFALDPRDFVDSPIPVADASDKASYEEVPALLKVKSNLSVKRAKELVAQAMEKDGIKKEQDADNHNWIRDLRAELKAKK